MIWMKFKLFGTKIYVSFLFTAVLALMLTTDRTGLALYTLLSVLIHECGHLFAMWLTDCQPKEIRLIPASVQIVRPLTSPAKNEILVALFGPAANLAVFFTLLLNYSAFRRETTLSFALLNLLIGGFNLLPVLGLDGGTVLVALLAKKWGEERARATARILTVLGAAGFLFTGVFFLLRGLFNPSFFIVGLYLAISSMLKSS